MDPSAPPQPSPKSSFNQSYNATSKTTAEQQATYDNTSQKEATIDRRGTGNPVPSHRSNEDSNPTPTSMGYGETGPLRERDISESDKENYSNDGNLEGEQMRAPGEGDVANAVRSGGGGGHKEQEELTRDLEGKAEAHEEELHRRGQRTGREIEEEEGEDWTGMAKNVDVGKALGGKEGEEKGLGERGTGVVLAAE